MISALESSVKRIWPSQIKRFLYRHRSVIKGYAFLSPYIIFFIGLWLYPFGYAFWLSFREFENLFETPRFVGLNHFRTMFQDELFLKSFLNIFRYMIVQIPLTIVFSLFVALALHSLTFLKGFFRTIYFVPNVVSLTVVAVMFMSLYSPSFGLINFYLGKIGIPPLKWLSSPTQAMPAIALMDVWRAVGFYAVIMLAGLQNIDPEYYEAAMIDGANGWRRLLYITIPLLNPTIVMCTMLNFIWAFQVFMQPFLMTAGGPLNSTWTPVYLLYRQSFQTLRLGYGTAIGIFLTVVILVVTVVQRKLVEREVLF